MPRTWFKGNIHTHTTNSDGDSSPEHVASWYRDHQYDFLVLSDHNHLTVLEDAEEHPAKWPLLIPGEEVTTHIGPNEIPIHLNGIGIGHGIEPKIGDSRTSTLQANLDLVRDAGGLPSINHPNQKWALSDREILSTSGAWALEVFNGNGDSNSFGGGGRGSAEAIWDRVLTAGQRVYAVATDDAHHFQGEFGPFRSNPGRGWVMVRTDSLEEDRILESLAQGDFYASTGPVLAEIRMSPREIVIETRRRRDEKFSISFYGDHGQELWRSEADTARYRPSRLDAYVRAVVVSSRGEQAWTQPLFLPG